MAKVTPIDREKEDELVVRGLLNRLIGEQVLHSLGTPGDLIKVQVSPVGHGNFRVNVFVGKNAGSAKVGDSFFLTADTDGNITSSCPKIERLY